MPRVTTTGQVTIPKDVREALGIEPGDEGTFEGTAEGDTIRKEAPTAPDGTDPFGTYRGSVGTDASMPERMRRLRGEHPRTVDEDDVDEDTDSETET